MVDRLQ